MFLRKLWTATGLVAVAVFLLTPAHCTGQSLKKVTEIEGIQEYRLANGIPVLLFPDQTKPQFTINMTVLVGSRHEGYGETGMAHLLEHMLFKGTPTHPDIPKLLKDRGVLNMNGTTWYDRTNYYETLPSSDDNLEFAIRMEADRLLNSTIRAEDLASEMTVVRNEFEIGENSPFRILFQRVMSSAYEWHNYGKSTIGNRSDIERVPIQNLREFYTKFYQPDNISVVIAGQFDSEKALEYLQTHFGGLALPDRRLPLTYTEEPVQDGERTVTLRRVGSEQWIGAGYHIPAAAHSDYAPLEVLSNVLGMEPAGRLYQALVKPGLASSASAQTIPGHDPGMFGAFCQLSAGRTIEEVQEVLLNTIEGAAAAGVNEGEVKRAVQSILKQRELQFANTEAVAIDLSEWQAYGDWRLYFLHRDRIEKVTASDVQRVAAAYLLPSNRTLGVFLPTEQPVRARIPQAPKLSELLAGYSGRARVAEGESFEPTPDNIDARTRIARLESGMQLALLNKKTRGERVFINGQIQYGSLESLTGHRVAATVLPGLMARGTRTMTFQQLTDRLDELRSSITLSGGPGTLSFSVQARRENLDPTLELLKQMLREPSFPAEELDVIRNEQITQLESGRSEPQVQAMMAMQKVTNEYGPDDPRYSPDIDQSIAEYRAVQAAEVAAVHSRFLNGSQGQIAVVGDFDASTIAEKLDSVFAGWTSAEKYARIPQLLPKAGGQRIEISTPDKANAIYIAAQFLPLRDDSPDYEAMSLGNYILGGGPLSSRLADRVRKKEGLSYAVASMLRADSQDETGALVMFAMSNPENTAKVVSTVDEEVARLVESGVAADELDAAKSSFLETRRGDRSDDRGLAATLRSNLELGRTMQFAADGDAKIAALQVEDVNQALRNRVDRSRLIIITAGDFEKKPDGENPTGETAGRENAGGGGKRP